MRRFSHVLPKLGGVVRQPFLEPRKALVVVAHLHAEQDVADLVDAGAAGNLGSGDRPSRRWPSCHAPAGQCPAAVVRGAAVPVHGRPRSHVQIATNAPDWQESEDGKAITADGAARPW